MKTTKIIAASPTMTKEMLGHCLGKRIGYGMTRVVHVWKPDPTLVVKVEWNDTKHFQNVEEWNAWTDVEYDDWHSRWFAPCVAISTYGSLLWMKRTTPATDGQLPVRIPRYLTDHKRSNYGMLDGRFVCHDYGTNMMREHGMTKHLQKMNLGDWHEGGES